MSSRMRVLQCYKQMLREGQKFTNYNFREYALRRVQDGFREHKAETDPQMIDKIMQNAEQNLNMLRRQAIISQLYTQKDIVVEHPEKT